MSHMHRVNYISSHTSRERSDTDKNRAPRLDERMAEIEKINDTELQRLSVLLNSAGQQSKTAVGGNI